MKHLSENSRLSDDEKLLLARCRDIIKKIEPFAEVVLYGSRVRGDNKPESDYDLLILIDGEVTLEREDLICRQLYPVGLETGKVLSAMVYSRQQWNSPLYQVMPFHENVEREGIIL